MISFNSESTALRVVLFSSLMIAYSIYFDVNDLKIEPSFFYYSQKIFFCLFPIYFLKKVKKLNIDFKVLMICLIYIVYSILHTYLISINYMISSLQVTLVFTSILFLDKIYYFSTFLFLTIGTTLAIFYSPSIAGFGQYGVDARFLYINDFLSLQILSTIIYFTTVIPRINILKEDLKFSHLGKASSFIIHELQKPINRLMENTSSNEDVIDLQNTLSLAKKIQINSKSEFKFEEIDFCEVVNKVITKYQNFISLLKIDIVFDDQLVKIISDRNTLITITDNLIRNAIEANMAVNEGERWINLKSDQYKITITNPFVNMISESDLFLPMKSSKEGNMGVGLYFCKSLAESMQCSVTAKIIKKKFEIKLHFNQN